MQYSTKKYVITNSSIKNKRFSLGFLIGFIVENAENRIDKRINEKLNK